MKGLSRSWFPFDVGSRILLFAGMGARVYPSNGSIYSALHPVPFGNRLVISGKPAQRDDDSVADSCTYPYPTVLDGVPDRNSGYRRLSPLHTNVCHASAWGIRFHLDTKEVGISPTRKSKLSKPLGPSQWPVRSSLSVKLISSERVTHRHRC